jgi:phosphoribosylamine--glycine ligase
MNCNDDPFLIEYNVRMGDPETEVIIPRLKNDLVELFELVASKKLGETTIEIDERSCSTVMLVSGGYPGNYEKGKIITRLEEITDSFLFHAGTQLQSGEIVTSGGRVIAVSSLGDNYKLALEKSYKNAEIVTFDKKYYRRDIGFDL